MIPLVLVACTRSDVAPPWPPVAPEVAALELELSGAIAESAVEMSGLAWAGDRLVLLPECDDGSDCVVYVVARGAVIEAVDRGSVIHAVTWPVVAEALDKLEGFDGFEAIAISGAQVWMTAERRPHGSWGIPGRLDEGRVVLDVSSAVWVEGTSGWLNKGDESALWVDDVVWTLHELNGPPAVDEPFLRRFERGMPAGTIPMPALTYRITDATALYDRQFDVLQYLWRDDDRLRTRADGVSQRWGVGPSHAGTWACERIVTIDLGPPLQVVGPPVHLVLSEQSRNWEGLVRLDDKGWLIVTDSHPRTILAFVPRPRAALADPLTTPGEQ